MKSTIETERKTRVAAENSRDTYLKDLGVAKDEIKTLASNVNTRTTVLRVAAKCPTQAATSTDTGGTIATVPELEEYARPAYYAHVDDESKVISLLNLCVRQLKIDRGILQ